MVDERMTNSDRIAVVTGATSGIGLVMAMEIARGGAHTIIVGRDRAKTDGVVARVREQTGNAKVEAALADFLVLNDVRALAADLRARLPHIDVLVHNAGAFFTSRALTVDGQERSFAGNHLAPFLLTELLRDRLSARSRIVVTASGAHSAGKIFFDDVTLAGHFSAWRAYAQSKLANVLFVRELARRLPALVTATCFHPGMVGTAIGAQNFRVIGAIWKAIGPVLFRTPARGARTGVWLATSPDVEGHSGGYYVDETLRDAAAQGRDDDVARRLWALSEQLTQAR